MNINFIATSKNMRKSERIGMIPASFFKDLENYNNSKIKLLRYIDIYDNTFFNKKQLLHLQKEIKFLSILSSINQKELNILKYAINFILGSPKNYDYLWLMGD